MTPAQALDLLKNNPLDVTPALQALQDAPRADDPSLAPLAARLDAAMPSRRDTEDLLGESPAILASFYPGEEREAPSTADTIDKFLADFGAGDPKQQQLLERMIFSPVPDYAATLAAEAAAEASTPQAAETSGIRAPQEAAPQVAEPSSPQTAEPSSPRPSQKPPLTESFVRILVKNGNYTKALEIISEQNLKNPEKSIYFADQMRFLKKLIINEKKK